jgi:hypothetical protein
LTLLTALAVSQSPSHDAGLLGWYVSGQLAEHELTTVPAACPTQGASDRAFLVRSKRDDAVGPAAVMQSFEAGKYAGKRVRFSGTVDARGVLGRAGLFVRVNDRAKVQVNDEMRGRWIRGDARCQRFSVVVDVPSDAEQVDPSLLSVGLALHGAGAVELSDVAFEEVGAGVPLTRVAFELGPRVGDLTFDDVEVFSKELLVWEQLKPGEWRKTSDAQVVKVDPDGRGLTQAGAKGGALRFTASDGTFEARGTWRLSSGAVEDVRFTWTKQALTLKRGTRERSLQRGATTLRADCEALEAGSGSRLADRLEVCGAAFTDARLQAPLVLALLQLGTEPEHGSTRAQQPIITRSNSRPPKLPENRVPTRAEQNSTRPP